MLISDAWKRKTRKLTPRTSTTSSIWVFQIKLSFCLDVNVANFSKIMARTVVTTSWCWKYWKDYFKARPVAMMKPRDQVSFWTLIEAYFRKTEKKKWERILYPHKIKNTEKGFPTFDEKSNSFSLPQTSLTQSQKPGKKGKRGTLFWITGGTKTFGGKVSKRKKLINHYF